VTPVALTRENVATPQRAGQVTAHDGVILSDLENSQSDAFLVSAVGAHASVEDVACPSPEFGLEARLSRQVPSRVLRRWRTREEEADAHPFSLGHDHRL